MPKGSLQLTEARREEIINACALLYQSMSFKDITLKEIGNITSFTRTSIYNYFQTKEEVFLALLLREYTQWTDELCQLCTDNDRMSRAEFADALAHSVENHSTLLKLLAMNRSDMEENSRMERLVEFKATYCAALEAVRCCLRKFFPTMTEEEIQSFLFSFFPFLFGIYPYTSITDRQKEAMRLAGFEAPSLTIYQITHSMLLKLLDEKETI